MPPLTPPYIDSPYLDAQEPPLPHLTASQQLRQARGKPTGANLSLPQPSTTNVPSRYDGDSAPPGIGASSGIAPGVVLDRAKALRAGVAMDKGKMRALDSSKDWVPLGQSGSSNNNSGSGSGIANISTIGGVKRNPRRKRARFESEEEKFEDRQRREEACAVLADRRVLEMYAVAWDCETAAVRYHFERVLCGFLE